MTVLHRGGVWIFLCSFIHVYANTPNTERPSMLLCTKRGAGAISVEAGSVSVCGISFLSHCKGSFMNALHPRSQSHVVSHRQYTGSDRKLGASTQHKIYKDSWRCQGHYLHGYRILQHQVQIKFLEAPSVSLAFPRMYEVVAAEALSKQHSELAAVVALLFSGLGFFIMCC